MASAPPPAGGGAGRSLTIVFESGRRVAPDALRINPAGATLEVGGFFHTPLKLTLGQLHLGMIDRGPATPKGDTGRFPILKRLSATSVVPREQGIEGWLWTTTGGSALTVLGDEDAAPSGAILFTKPLTAEQLKPTMEPKAYEALIARSPLGEPAIPGILFRAAEPSNAETAFRTYGLLRPLTDREVPPVMRRSLPTDRPADPSIAAAPAPRGTSVAPPGF
ncbi:hypothetical protein DVA67_011500 [Solirubrobacter sp. CPCC 204708]|uniref:Pirin C-terminal domain-containing protein n=1 Tax=Solirubrobacter deserti TaxID=2282478 RepID=A0ABT4RPK7_9ACTN|nr:hypothetical protein [Solirubrobacter deserti]MBE2316604.1 hypothetical protein [Solirubrobacter deserti]MDA0140502.1 hypothetical protein [Solirubrobacter deserti]